MESFVLVHNRDTNQIQHVPSGTYFLRFSNKDMNLAGYKTGDNVYVIVNKEGLIQLYNKKEEKDFDPCECRMADMESKNDLITFRTVTKDYFAKQDLTGLPLIKKLYDGTDIVTKGVPIQIGKLASNPLKGVSEAGSYIRLGNIKIPHN